MLSKDEVVACVNRGYNERMYHAVAYTREDEDYVGLNEEFDTDIILPEINEKHDKPRAYFITPVCYEEDCFGYGVIISGSVLVQTIFLSVYSFLSVMTIFLFYGHSNSAEVCYANH
jgi:hypothetical protein